MTTTTMLLLLLLMMMMKVVGKIRYMLNLSHTFIKLYNVSKYLPVQCTFKVSNVLSMLHGVTASLRAYNAPNGSLIFLSKTFSQRGCQMRDAVKC
jgi:hypothetical protein